MCKTTNKMPCAKFVVFGCDSNEKNRTFLGLRGYVCRNFQARSKFSNYQILADYRNLFDSVCNKKITWDLKIVF